MFEDDWFDLRQVYPGESFEEMVMHDAAFAGSDRAFVAAVVHHTHTRLESLAIVCGEEQSKSLAAAIFDELQDLRWSVVMHVVFQAQPPQRGDPPGAPRMMATGWRITVDDEMGGVAEIVIGPRMQQFKNFREIIKREFDNATD